jgi:CRISPR-associated endonuclease Csn1
LNYGNSTIRDFIFRYHLDSMKLKRKELKEFMYFHIKSLSDKRLMECIKVRLNHLGDIVQIGEY